MLNSLHYLHKTLPEEWPPNSNSNFLHYTFSFYHHICCFHNINTDKSYFLGILLISCGFVVYCQVLLVIDSFGIMTKIFKSNWHSSCRYFVWTAVLPFFPRKFLECFQKSLFSSGLTYFVTQKLTVYF